MKNKILIVDDASFMRTTIRDILESGGFEIVGEAENGELGIDLYESLHPDLVIMDITMPVMDGLEALKRIKKIDQAAKVVMCSAMGQQEIVIESIKCGANDFIVKPFQSEKVIEAVKRAIA
ncbi:MAG: response regulator [Lachnospiraceae bacterium]|nr:response regulator [Lachnospiraceae bacterium]